MSERLHFHKFTDPPLGPQAIYKYHNNSVDPLKDPRLFLDKALYELVGQDGLIRTVSDVRRLLTIIQAFSEVAYDIVFSLRDFSKLFSKLDNALLEDRWSVVNRIVENLTVPIGFSSLPWLPDHPIPVNTPIFPNREQAGNKKEDLSGTWYYYRALVSRCLDEERTLFTPCLIEHVSYCPALSKTPLVRLSFDIPPEDVGDEDVFRSIEVVSASTDSCFSETTRSYSQTGKIYTRHTGFCGSLALEERRKLTQSGFPSDTDLPLNIPDFQGIWDKLVRCASVQTPITLSNILH